MTRAEEMLETLVGALTAEGESSTATRLHRWAKQWESQRFERKAFTFHGIDPKTGAPREFVVDYEDRPWWAEGVLPDAHPDSKEAWVVRQANFDWAERQRKKGTSNDQGND